MLTSDFIIKIELDAGGTISLGSPGETAESIGEVIIEPASDSKSVTLNDSILALVVGVRKAEWEATD